MTIYPADLHMHTHYSDGMRSPAEVVTVAQDLGLEVIAITDHDTVRGVKEAIPLAEAAGIELIPAVELTTTWIHAGQVGRVDLLGYFVNLADSGFQTLVADALADIEARVADCCRFLSSSGYPLSLEDVRRVNPRYAGVGPAIEALYQCGYAESFREAAQIFLPQWNKVRPARLGLEDAIRGVAAAGGVPVLAHPRRIAVVDGWLDAEHLRPLVMIGLGGLEVYHPTADADLNAHLLNLTEQFGIAATGGSDSHGHHRQMGTQPVTRAAVEALRARSQGGDR